MKTDAPHPEYAPPAVLSVRIAPDLTKCMQNTGGTEERSTFRVYQENAVRTTPPRPVGPTPRVVPLLGILLLSVASARSAEIPILIPQQHPVIMEIVEGTKKGLEELGYRPPDYDVVLLDGQGVQANFPTVIDAAIQKHPPLIIAITTGLSKTVVDQVNGRLPVVFSGVTDPVGAGIVSDLVAHANVTGASDRWPIEDQLHLITGVLPRAKTVGVIFRPSEANSQYGMRIAREAAKRLGLQLVERGVEDPKEVVSVLEAILPNSDAIYIGPDNMTIESAKVIVESSAQGKKPVFGGEPGTLERGAVGVVSIEYFELGRETAKLCDKILKGTPAEQVPVYVAERGHVGLNYDSAYRLGIAISPEVRATAVKVIGTYREPLAVAPAPRIAVIVLVLLGLVVVILIAWRIVKSRRPAPHQ